MNHRLAIVSTHPIQYNAPLFRMIHEDRSITLQVFFSRTWNQVKYDPDFRRDITWDIPVEEGYQHTSFDSSTSRGKSDLIRTITNFSPNVILVYGWNFPGHLRVIRHFHNQIPIWFRGDSHLLDPLPKWKRAIRRTILHWVYLHVDIFYSVGTANEAYFHWCGVNPKKILRAPHAIDQAFFQEDDETKKKCAIKQRSELGIPISEKTILFVGKLEPKKQPELILKAWKGIEGPKPHVLIVGSGILEEQLKKKWGHLPKVHFLGFKNQQAMPIVYRMADLMCMPSKGPGETWGLAVNEAFACNVPCIVSNRAGCSLDIIQDDHHGKVISWNEIDQWSEAISEFISETKPKGDWSKVNQHFSYATFLQALRSQLAKLK